MATEGLSEEAKMEEDEEHGTCSGRTEKGDGMLSRLSTLEKRRLESDLAADGGGDESTLLGLVSEVACFPSGAGDRVTTRTALGRCALELAGATPAASSAGVALVLNHGADSAAVALSRAAASTASKPTD